MENTTFISVGRFVCSAVRSNHGRRLLSRAFGRVQRGAAAVHRGAYRRPRRSAEEVAVNPPSALSRRSVVSHHRIVNCRPAQCCIWPVLAPARAFVRAYQAARPCVSLATSRVRHCPALRSCRRALRSASPGLAFLSRRFALVSRLLFAALRQTGTACGVLRFYSARVGIAVRAFS